MEKVDDKFRLISKIILYLLPILGLIGIVIPLVIGKNNLSILSTYLAVPMILSSIIYIKQSKNQTNLETLNNKQLTFFISVYFIFISISIYLLYIFEIRPYIYYIIISISSIIILLEILLFEISKKKEIMILFQIAILFINIIWGVTLKYNLFIGRTDLLGHVWFTQNLINNDHVTEIFGIYKPFPLWHILCGFMYEILGTSLSIQKTLSFTNGIIYFFVPISIYLISKKIFENPKLPLLSALFVALNSDIIYYGMSSISRSVISFLEVMLVLTLLDSNNPKKIFLSIILAFSLVIYHTASMPFILMILIGVYILNKLYAKGDKDLFLSLEFIVLAISITLFYWIYYAKTLLGSLIANILEPAPVGILTKSIIFTPLNELFNYLQYSFVLFFIIIGFFAAIDSKKISSVGKTFCIMGLFAVPVTFPGPSLLFNKLAENLQLDRFAEYTFIFIGITATIGFYAIYSRANKFAKICLIILFMLMAILSTSNDFNASDNPLVKRPFYTFYFTNEEENAIQHIASISDGNVMSDYVTGRYLSFSKYVNKTQVIQVDTKHMEFLRNQTNDTVLIRKSELSKRPLKLSSVPSGFFIKGGAGQETYDYYYQDNSIWRDLSKYSKIYDSNGVVGLN